MRGELIIAPCPPSDGRDWESQCARCGSSTFEVICESCGGDGRTEFGELHAENPLWYDYADTATCENCGGDGGWTVCVSGEQWCQGNPLPGREAIERGQIEWFTVERPLSEEGV